MECPWKAEQHQVLKQLGKRLIFVIVTMTSCLLWHFITVIAFKAADSTDYSRFGGEDDLSLTKTLINPYNSAVKTVVVCVVILVLIKIPFFAILSEF